MTTLDEHYVDLLNTDDDPDLTQLVAELDTLREGSPSLRGDLMIRHALAVHAQELAETGRSRSTQVGVARHRRWTHPLPARLSLAVAASVAVLFSVGTYLHGQSPTPVSAQTVLHRAAAASPGPNEATHAIYRVTGDGGFTGTGNVWIGYDGGGAPNELALMLAMTQDGHPAASLSATLVAAGPGLLQAYHPEVGGIAAQMPIPAKGAATPPGKVLSAAPDAPGRAMKGMVVGTLLAQKLSKQPDAYKLQQTTLDDVPVYELQPAGADGGATYYFNAQTYVLEGADWMQNGKSWQARLDSYSTVPLSSV